MIRRRRVRDAEAHGNLIEEARLCQRDATRREVVADMEDNFVQTRAKFIRP